MEPVTEYVHVEALEGKRSKQDGRIGWVKVVLDDGGCFHVKEGEPLPELGAQVARTYSLTDEVKSPQQVIDDARAAVMDFGRRTA